MIFFRCHVNYYILDGEKSQFFFPFVGETSNRTKFYTLNRNEKKVDMKIGRKDYLGNSITGACRKEKNQKVQVCFR